MIAHHTFGPLLWGVDAEWIPCADTGRRRYGLPPEMPDAEVIDTMYRMSPAYDPEKKPRPYLPTPLCRVVAIGVASWHLGDPAAEVRSVLALRLEDEGGLLRGWLQSLRRKPQIFTYNGRNADFPIVLQRALRYDLIAADLLAGGNRDQRNYMDRYNTSHVDFADTMLVGWGSAKPKLDDLCAALRIPGKAGLAGDQVLGLVQDAQEGTLRQYVEEDAMRVLTIGVRLAAMAGLITATAVPWSADVRGRHPAWGEPSLFTTPEETR